MNTFFSVLRFLDDIAPPRSVSAHCDVPCGVYEPDSMTWAAETVMKLCEKLQGLKLSDPESDEDMMTYHNTLTRAVMVKEEYAQICKKELLILWTDWFKPEHLEKWPDLHDKIWNATKQCSVVKRGVSVEEAKKLQEMVAEIAEIFQETKK